MTTRDFFKINDQYIFKAKEPISALSHFIGYLLSIIFTPILLIKAAYHHASLLSLISLSIFMLTMIILYGASASYHSFNISYRVNKILKKIDHMSIFILIAGSYTPVCLIALKEHNGIKLLIAIWFIALLGIIFKAFWVTCPKIISSIVYTLMGWLCIIVLPDLLSVLPKYSFIFLLLGGIFYTIGAIIYALKLKIFKNEYFGNHELFHCFILLGSLMHYIFMFNYMTILG